ncbi:hypothetical protein IAQ61_006409 [Plenodomus lingam]|uniref:uncharacterized protein n=1 Tax=Leptosphaeria maculans TaxID=5022 RepID=UPI0033290E47|nr:hypothetical protein IAQ61_006409 [Plenodomus lingam]
MSPIVESCLLYYLHRVQGHYQRIVQNVAKRASEAASPSLHFLQLRGTFANANTGNGEIDDQGKAKKRAMLTVSSNGHGEKFAMHRRIAPCLAIHCEQTQDKSNFTPSRRQMATKVARSEHELRATTPVRRRCLRSVVEVSSLFCPWYKQHCLDGMDAVFREDALEAWNASSIDPRGQGTILHGTVEPGSLSTSFHPFHEGRRFDHAQLGLSRSCGTMLGLGL